MKDKEESELFNVLKELNNSLKDINLNTDLFYNTPLDLIVQEGECFSTEKWNEEEQELINFLYSNLKTSIKPSECYKNSQLVVINDVSNKIKYHEGFCDANVGLPIPHAWNSLNGKLLDFTLQYNGKTKFSDKSHIGIEIDKAWVLDCFFNKKNSTSYINNHEDINLPLRNKYIKPSSK